MSKQQTAVEWLAEKYNYVTWMRNRDEISAGLADEWRKHYLEQAKELEKQQIEYAETKDIQQLIDRNYAAQIRRGQNLTPIACLAKINEEIEEYNKEWAYVNNEEAQQKELSDIILSCFTNAKVMGWDIMQILSEKVAYNEKRED